MNRRTIQYAIDLETELIWSRVDNEVAVPILGFDEGNPSNHFEMGIYLEKMVLEALRYQHLKWTRKIPVEWKNYHRRFWGMKELSLCNES